MKIKPKYPKEFPKMRSFYGSNSDTSAKGMRVKTNCICPDIDCNYSSRNWVVAREMSPNQKASVSSKFCPKHNLELVNIGNACVMPKGKKEKIELLKSLNKWK